MASDEDFAHRIREQLTGEGRATEQAIFGGPVFLLRGNVAAGISNGGGLVGRLGPDTTDDATAQPAMREQPPLQG